MTGKKIKILSRILLWSILSIVLIWILDKKIVPGGYISYHTDFIDNPYFFGKLSPQNRIKTIDRQIALIGNPVYFSFETPRRFNQARLTVKYKNISLDPAGTTPADIIFEAGILVDKTQWRYQLKPLDNQVLDNLIDNWSAIHEGNLYLLQKNKKFVSVQDFLDNLPDKNSIALYNYNLDREFIIKDYQPQKMINEIDVPIRGPYQIMTYIKDEDLKFKLNFLDLNKNKDSDPIQVNVYYQDQIMNTYSLDDPGEAKDDGIAKDRGDLNVELANLPEGAYKIEVKANNDVVTRSIATTQSKLSFVNKVWLSENNRKIRLFTDSKELLAQTINPGSLQNIEFGDKTLQINQTFHQFNIISVHKMNEVKINKSDVIIAGNGMFSFSPDSLINPLFRKIDSNLDVDNEGIEYILADYVRPNKNGEWRYSTLDFDLTQAYQEKNFYSFLLSWQETNKEKSSSSAIVIGDAKVELFGKDIPSFISEKINSIKNK